MARKRQFGQLSKRARDRAARNAKEFDLTRRQVRERYNRGTYNPLAPRTSIQHIPRELRRYAVELEDGTITVSWQRAAYANMRHAFGPDSPKGERIKWNDERTQDAIYSLASEAIARVMALASDKELEAWARPQPDANGNPPPFESWEGLPAGLTMADMGYTTDGGWNNIFWYH
jgi:hypothetical protein